MRVTDIERVTFECIHFATHHQYIAMRETLDSGPGGRFELDASGIRDKQTFFDRLAASLRFPDYFGANWDAVLDCLRDLSWLERSSYVLFVHSAHELFDEARPIADEFVNVWRSAATCWISAGVPFHLVFVRAAPTASWVG